MQERKFYICMKCKNLVGMIHDAGVPLYCCGQPMEELNAHTSGDAAEKHLPVITKSGYRITVNAGTVAHPMEDAHHIDWIYLQTKHGGQRKRLAPSAAPAAHFVLTEDDEAIAAYAYCNLHGVWKSDKIEEVNG